MSIHAAVAFVLRETTAREYPTHLWPPVLYTHLLRGEGPQREEVGEMKGEGPRREEVGEMKGEGSLTKDSVALKCGRTTSPTLIIKAISHL